jgi:hypothetical protein
MSNPTVAKFLTQEVPRGKDFEVVNAAIDALAGRRRARIVVAGPLRRSKLAWKIATYQEAVLYRVVMLTSGAALAWNSGNILTCVLAVRAVIETVAVFNDFTDRLNEAVEAKDLDDVDSLVTNRLFATRDRELVERLPDTMAINVLTVVKKLDRLIPGVFDHYEDTSELCHPNGRGHHQFFVTLDSNWTVTYADPVLSERFATHILAPLGLLAIFDDDFIKVESMVEEVANIQSPAE